MSGLPSNQGDAPVRVDGTAGGFHIRVTWGGGAVHIDTPAGVIVFPHRIGDPDRQPRLNGEPIT